MDFIHKNTLARNFIHLNDAQKDEILALRNDESVRKFMLNPKIISKKEHYDFIESLKTAKNMAYFGVYFVKESDSINENNLMESHKDSSNFAESHNNNKTNPHEVRQTLAPLRGAKNQNQVSSSANADFLLEAENSEALSLKAKKRSFWRARESGERGAALFAKENNFAESHQIESAESNNNPHEVRTLCVVGGGERLRGEGSDFAIQAPSPLAKNTIIDSKIKAESKQSKSIESSAESQSQGDSNDSINENNFTKSTESRKDSSDKSLQNLALHSKQNNADSADLLGVVCFNNIDFFNKNAFFGIYSNTNARNGENLIKMLEFIAFKTLNLHILYAKVLSNNIRALKFYAKHHFLPCGKMIEAVKRGDKFIDIEIFAKINKG